MSREAHVQFYERVGVKLPRATHPIAHCRTREGAERLREAIIRRLAECGLELNLEKTKIVYCKDDDRKGSHEHEKFTFLGNEFRPRRAKNYKGQVLRQLPAGDQSQSRDEHPTGNQAMAVPLTSGQNHH